MEDLCTQGRCNARWSQASLYMRELKAIEKARRALQPAIQGRDVRIQSDNATIVAYLDRQGETKSPRLSLTETILFQSTSGIHLKGTDNTLADFLSRKTIKQTEWSLNQATFLWITQTWRVPQVDLFVSRTNAKLPRFFSLDTTDGNIRVDTFNQSWAHQPCYAFPLTALIPKVSQRIMEERATVILVAPHWPQGTWFSHSKKLSPAAPDTARPTGPPITRASQPPESQTHEAFGLVTERVRLQKKELSDRVINPILASRKPHN